MIRAYKVKKHPRGDAISPRGYLVCMGYLVCFLSQFLLMPLAYSQHRDVAHDA